jgi:hypothetical protein
VRTGARILQADAQPSTPERWRRRGAQPVRSSSSRGKGKRAPVDAGDRQRQRRPLHPPTDGTTHAPPHPSRSAEEAAEPRLATPRESTRGPTMSSPRRSHSTLDSELSRRNPVLRYPTREYQTDRVAHPPGPPPPQPSPTPTPASKTPASNDPQPTSISVTHAPLAARTRSRRKRARRNSSLGRLAHHGDNEFPHRTNQ